MPAWLGRDPRSTDPLDLVRAIAALSKIRPYVRKFHSSEYINDLANGDLCASLGYSGDVIQARNRAREAKNGIALACVAPREGAEMAVDMLAIPQNAPHPAIALEFIDYILRPSVIADITDAVSYPNPNLAATPIVNRAIRDDPQVYPPEAVRRRFFVATPVPADYERTRTRAWTRRPDPRDAQTAGRARTRAWTRLKTGD
jgi:putrescine transport system substrate-binding protein